MIGEYGRWSLQWSLIVTIVTIILNMDEWHVVLLSIRLYGLYLCVCSCDSPSCLVSTQIHARLSCYPYTQVPLQLLLLQLLVLRSCSYISAVLATVSTVMGRIDFWAAHQSRTRRLQTITNRYQFLPMFVWGWLVLCYFLVVQYFYKMGFHQDCWVILFFYLSEIDLFMFGCACICNLVAGWYNNDCDENDDNINYICSMEGPTWVL